MYKTTRVTGRGVLLAAALLSAIVISTGLCAPASAEPPAAPGSLSAEVGPTTVVLTWAPVPGTIKYQVSRTSPGYSRFVKTETTRFAELGLGAGQRHEYAVRALGGSGLGAATTLVVMTPLPQKVAAAKRLSPKRFAAANRKCLTRQYRQTGTIVNACLHEAARAARGR